MAGKATRASFGEKIVELGEKNKDIVVLDADLGGSTKTGKFKSLFPDRYIQMGIAEANMVGTAGGMALAGLTPFICSFACFITGRYDIIRMSVAYPKANVKIIGTHAGIGVGEDGNSQQGLEDIGLMRALPNMQVIQPCDDLEAKMAIEYAASTKSPVYLRLTRQNLPDVHNGNYKFQIGKADMLMEGKDISLFASGSTVAEALEANESLKAEGISAEIINIHSLKPFDSDTVISSAKKTGRVITVEDHNIIGGLGTCVAETLAEGGVSAKFKRLGLQDLFGRSGDPKELYQYYGIDSSAIVKTVKQLLK